MVQDNADIGWAPLAFDMVLGDDDGLIAIRTGRQRVV